jgi:hypothetical protein
MEERLGKLKELCELQKESHDYNDYMRGMANGIILALSIMEGNENPEFILEVEEV